MRLCLRQNTIQELEGLSCLAASLQELDLYDNLIAHIKGLDPVEAKGLTLAASRSPSSSYEASVLRALVHGDD